MNKINEKDLIDLESAAFRKLILHLRENPEIQNIELMNIADFCRNCLSKWFLSAANEKGISLDYDQARKIIYGMPYNEWKAKYQKEATPEQKAKFEARNKSL
tara:strand:+ start:742 stop:1047 length:306 start_codon:yes stop_codon:yes gene_type:complete